MKISKVTLENYKQFFRAKIKFLLRNEIELVLGSNAAGKTTRVEAISWD